MGISSIIGFIRSELSLPIQEEAVFSASMIGTAARAAGLQQRKSILDIFTGTQRFPGEVEVTLIERVRDLSGLFRPVTLIDLLVPYILSLDQTVVVASICTFLILCRECSGDDSDQEAIAAAVDALGISSGFIAVFPYLFDVTDVGLDFQERFINCLESKRGFIRRRAMRELPKVLSVSPRPGAVFKGLEAVLADVDPRVRMLLPAALEAAARRMTRGQADALIPTKLNSLRSDPWWPVRLAVAERPGLPQALVSLLEDGHPIVRAGAITSAFRFSFAAGDGVSYDRVDADESAGRLPFVSAAILKSVGHPSVIVRRALAAGLPALFGRNDCSVAVGAACDLMADNDSETSVAALSGVFGRLNVLGEADSRVARARLLVLRAGSWRGRVAALEALVQMVHVLRDVRDLVPVLGGALADPADAVRKEAGRAMATLIPLVNDPRFSADVIQVVARSARAIMIKTRIAALHAFTCLAPVIGARGLAVLLPVIFPLCRVPIPDVRLAAASALAAARPLVDAGVEAHILNAFQNLMKDESCDVKARVRAVMGEEEEDR